MAESGIAVNLSDLLWLCKHISSRREDDLRPAKRTNSRRSIAAGPRHRAARQRENHIRVSLCIHRRQDYPRKSPGAVAPNRRTAP
jgi:hypothetical protein